MRPQRRLAALALIVASAVVLAGCASSDGTQPAAAKTLKLTWSDEFSGAAGTLPDADKWNFVQSGNGQGNNELECYTDAPGNVSLNGTGDLVITAIKQPGHICADGSTNDYTSARINTQNKFTAKYGRLEVRAKVPVSSGSWPAFWALGSNIETSPWPASGEIDVMEVIGSEPTIVHGTLHGPSADGSAYNDQVTIDSHENLSAAFHTYATTWTPTSVTFSFDGKAYGTESKKKVEADGGKWVFDHSFYLLLNLAVGGNYPGPPNATATWPQKYTIDWVRVYS